VSAVGKIRRVYESVVSPITDGGFETLLSTFELQTYVFSNSSGTVVVVVVVVE
jgi:hypothetical protein